MSNLSVEESAAHLAVPSQTAPLPNERNGLLTRRDLVARAVGAAALVSTVAGAPAVASFAEPGSASSPSDHFAPSEEPLYDRVMALAAIRGTLAHAHARKEQGAC
jgi:hypothetical protein